MIGPVATDTFEQLRVLALRDMASEVVPLRSPRRRRLLDDTSVPEIPAGVATGGREGVPWVLWEEAEEQWRKHTHVWTPSLSRLYGARMVSVVIRRGDMDVTMRNGTHRAKGLPLPWIPVVVAVLTGRELPAVRAAMRRGVNVFVREETSP
jgi:hypothetical protein